MVDLRNEGEHRGLFDKFADEAEKFVGHAAFFSACVVAILIWAPTYFLLGNLDTWQLIINTFTTIVTFLLVALLQNTQERFERAVNARLQAVLEALNVEDPVNDEGQVVTKEDIP